MVQPSEKAGRNTNRARMIMLVRGISWLPEILVLDGRVENPCDRRLMGRATVGPGNRLDDGANGWKKGCDWDYC
jgi:hypothetical protein